MNKKLLPPTRRSWPVLDGAEVLATQIPIHKTASRSFKELSPDKDA